jgi:hypothetical protein
MRAGQNNIQALRDWTTERTEKHTKTAMERSPHFVKSFHIRTKTPPVSAITVEGRVVEGSRRAGRAVVEGWAQKWRSTGVEHLPEGWVDHLPEMSRDQIQTLTKAISPDAIYRCMRNAPTNKVAGPDGIPNLFWKIVAADADVDDEGVLVHGSDRLANRCSKILSRIIKSGCAPQSMRRSHLVLLRKAGAQGAADRAPPLTALRPISIPNTDYRLVQAALAGGLGQVLTQTLSKAQTGFLPDRHIVENILGVTSAILAPEEWGLHGGAPHVLLLDLKAAYDTLPRTAVRECMTRLGSPQWMRDWFTTTHTGDHVRVKILGRELPGFYCTRGVRQGCPLAPLIFILTLEPLILRLQRITGVIVYAYADDIAILAPADAWAAVFQALREWETATHMRFSPQKSWFIPCHGQTDAGPPTGALTDGPVGVSRVQRYLGVMVGPDAGRTTMHDAIQRLHGLADSVHRHHSWMTLGARAALARIFMWSTAVYTCMVAPPTEAEDKEASDTMAEALWGRDRNGHPIYRISREMIHTGIRRGGLGIPSLKDISASVLLPILVKTLTETAPPAMWKGLRTALRTQGIHVALPLQALRLDAERIRIRIPEHPLVFALKQSLQNGWGVLYAPRQGATQVTVADLCREPIRANPMITDPGGGRTLFARLVLEQARGRAGGGVGQLVSTNGNAPSATFLQQHGLQATDTGRIRTARSAVPSRWIAIIARAHVAAEGSAPWPITGELRREWVLQWYPRIEVMVPEAWTTGQAPTRASAVQTQTHPKPKWVTAKSAVQAWMQARPAAWHTDQWKAMVPLRIDDECTGTLIAHLQKKKMWGTQVLVLSRAYLVGARGGGSMHCTREECAGTRDTLDHHFRACPRLGYDQWEQKYIPEIGSPELRCLWWGLWPYGLRTDHSTVFEAVCDAARRRQRVTDCDRRAHTPSRSRYIHFAQVHFEGFRAALGPPEGIDSWSSSGNGGSWQRLPEASTSAGDLTQ